MNQPTIIKNDIKIFKRHGFDPRVPDGVKVYFLSHYGNKTGIMEGYHKGIYPAYGSYSNIDN
jgi:hypothetical protein